MTNVACAHVKRKKWECSSQCEPVTDTVVDAILTLKAAFDKPIQEDRHTLHKIARCLSWFSSRWVLGMKDCLSREQFCVYISTLKCLTNYFRCHHPSSTEPGQASCNLLWTM